ncbi:hypothetical protein MIND_00941700 [Mycena indigotica]|uniref:leucine--tRNA ligase n=1 Tax=Mycena indigotica TaxID=2126181 RepID=A0A8H6SCT2_9AGAR|nr:uncharacterized protein MIND_00941700 [Mycena indigotica]KAF7297088.1 hypothetical protein MIND_00941700 [Mycena indigotica]
MATEDTKPIELVQTGKRDYLITLEKRYQAAWARDKIFEVNAPPIESVAGLSIPEIHDKHPKWFGTFPYPYMNGSLHLGHAFTISKIEFAAGYQRMLGKTALFPHGFHVTGLPIKASADKLIREMELFGPDFQNFEEVSQQLAAEAEETEKPIAVVQDGPINKAKAKKGKIVAKSTGLAYQFQILQSINIPTEEIKLFADPQHWLKYFPPIAIEDHTAFGSRIDWRRQFLTTPANPYYDAFVRWQMNKLHRLGKIKFGERYTIYSPKDGQPCMDHDRSDGEGLGPQEYTAIKMEVVEWSEAANLAVVEKLSGRKVFLVAATLRPETMYGQTNCFVGPSLKYGVFAMNDEEAFVCTYRAARNMAFQGISKMRGEIKQLLEISGSALVGTLVNAPFSLNPQVYVLPMDTVLPSKGTGVVTSVPSDSPDDCATLTDLVKKPAFYKIKPEWASFPPTPVINTPGFGDLIAPELVKRMKIQSQKDAKQLAEAKEIAYKEGFYNGVMLVGEFKGMRVEEAKPRVREAMIQAGLAMAYAEPEGLIVSRSGDECIVALMDQWYLDYGETTWRTETERLVNNMELYQAETRHSFEKSLAWLNQWACARTYGLGSQLPWDPHFLVESLTDSTIYMSYYTVAQLLHENDMYGLKPGPLGITPDQMTDEIWEYIFCDGPFPTPSPLSQDKADALKYEFNYFYPLDIRSSAKDLVPNHLTFCLYNHVALFSPENWPRSMRTNGHLLLNGQKMSKSKGNSLTLREAINKFGADATRLSLADAGDGVEDANFDEKSANANILRVHTLVLWCEEMVKEQANLRHGPKSSYHDKVFEHEVNELVNITQSHYEAYDQFPFRRARTLMVIPFSTNYKDALKYGFYELQTARDWYREVTSDIGMHTELVLYWIRISALLIAPIAPHFAEHIYSTILQSSTSIQQALWPTPPPVDPTIVETGVYMRGTTKQMRDSEAALIKFTSKNKGKKGNDARLLYDPKQPKAVRIYVATTFPQWQDACVQIIKEVYDPATDQVDDVKVRGLLTAGGLIKDKRVMPFVQDFKKRMAQFGAQTAFRRTVPYSERDVLSDIEAYLKRSLGLTKLQVYSVEEALARSEDGFTASVVQSAEPGSPAFEYYNV